MTLNEQLSDICTQCGMCCDGTLFNHAKIIDDADAVAVEGLGLTILTKEDKKRYFPQPCACFKTCCTVYERRPKVCISFYCAPLKKVRNNEMDLKEAQKDIQTALHIRAELQALIAHHNAFSDYTISQLLKDCKPKPTEVLRQNPAVLIKTIALTVALAKLRTQNKKN
jgi:uncharacterized protein